MASLDKLVSKKPITKAVISLRGCAGWSAQAGLRLSYLQSQRQVFSRRGLIIFLVLDTEGRFIKDSANICKDYAN